MPFGADAFSVGAFPVVAMARSESPGALPARTVKLIAPQAVPVAVLDSATLLPVTTAGASVGALGRVEHVVVASTTTVTSLEGALSPLASIERTRTYTYRSEP